MRRIKSPREVGREPERVTPRRPNPPSASPAVSGGYEQLPEEGDEQERAAREWLRHVRAGRIGWEQRP